MSTVAQRVQLGPFFSAGTIQGAAKLYHYAAGTSTLKNIWSDRAQVTTLAQPFVADANGVFNFFADGIYKLIVCGPNSTGPAVDVLYTLDNWSFLDPTDPTFDEGTAIASSSAISVGPEVWAHITGSTNIDTIGGTIPFFWAVFDGNLTLNYSASLLTPASINLAVRQGDVVFFLNEGSNVWRVAAHYQVDGLLIATQDSRTVTVDDALTVRSTTSGTPATDIGTGILLQAESADESPSDVARLSGRFTDVSAGSEDSYFEVMLRTAGAALSRAFVFLRTANAYMAEFVHANTADRIYTLQDSSDTIVMRNTTDTLTNKTLTSPVFGGTPSGNAIGTGAMKTATGSASGNVNGTTAAITMNDYAFSPNVQNTTNTRTVTIQAVGAADTSTTVGRFQITETTGTASQAYVVRWRYITASDDPTIWVLHDPSTGKILGVWASDDPTPGDVPGIESAGLVSKKLKAKQLEVLSVLNAKASDAAALIQERKLKMANQAYRALQLHSGDGAPAKWLLDNCEMGPGGLLRMKP